MSTSEIVGDEQGRVRAMRLHEVRMGESGFEKVEGTEQEIPASSCCWRWASSGRSRSCSTQLGVELRRPHATSLATTPT